MRKLSIIIANRHQTSISLEDEFFEQLQSFAKEDDVSINKLVTSIDSEREQGNLSSAVRIYILKRLQNKI